jgi:hypothetical protein
MALQECGSVPLLSTSSYIEYSKTNSVTINPQANYTDWSTATCRRNLMPTFVDRGMSRGQRDWSPTVINLIFLDRIRYFFQVFLRNVRRLLVAARVVPSSPIFVTLMKEAPGSSETSVLTRATRCDIPKDIILHIHRRENLKSYSSSFALTRAEWTPFQTHWLPRKSVSAGNRTRDLSVRSQELLLLDHRGGLSNIQGIKYLKRELFALLRVFAFLRHLCVPEQRHKAAIGCRVKGGSYQLILRHHK